MSTRNSRRISRRVLMAGASALAVHSTLAGTITPQIGGGINQFDGALGGASSPEAAFIAGLKADGIFSLLNYFVIGDQNLSNLIDPTRPGIAVNSPTFTAPLSYTGNGTSSRVLLPLTPSVEWASQQDDCGFGYGSLGDTASNSKRMGTTATNPAAIVSRGATNSATGQLNSSGAGSVSNNDEALGMVSWLRTDSATLKFFRGPVQFGANQAVASTGLATSALWGLGANPSSFHTEPQSFWWGGRGAAMEAKMPAFFARIRTLLNARKVYPFTNDAFGHSFTFTTAYPGDLPTVANFHPRLTNTALTSLGCRVTDRNYGSAGINSSAFAGNMLDIISKARIPINPGILEMDIGENDVAAGLSSAESQANIVSGGTTGSARGYRLILVHGRHYDNLTSGADTVSVQLASNLTQRTYQQAAVAQLVAAGINAIYVDHYAWMRALINAATYVQGDHLWHEGATDPHLNAIGQQIKTDAKVAALVAAGWPARLV